MSRNGNRGCGRAPSLAARLTGINDFLSAVSILQVARIAGAVPRALTWESTRFLRRALASPGLRTICRERRLALPLMLRNFLLDEVEEETDEPVDPPLFQWYLDLWFPVQHDREIRAFLDASTGDAPGGLRWEDRTAPRVLARLLTETDRELEVGDRIGLGFFGFCRYCDEFTQLMRSCERFPLFQAAIWHSHLGWAADYDRLRDSLLTGIQALEQLGPTDGTGVATEPVRARLARLAGVAIVLFRDPPTPAGWWRTWSEAGMPQRA